MKNILAVLMAVFTVEIRAIGTAIMHPIATVRSAVAAASIVVISKYRISPKSAIFALPPSGRRFGNQMGALDAQSVVMLMIVGLLAAILVPIAIDQFIAVDTTSWSATTVTIWDNLPTIIAVALLLGFVGFFLFGRGRLRR